MTTLESLAAKFPQYICTLFQGSLNILPKEEEDWRVSIFDLEGSYDLSCLWGFSKDPKEWARPRAIKFENLDAKGLEKAVVYVLALKKGF